MVDLEIVLRGSKPRIVRRIRISYQRPVGALHEAIQLAFGLPDTGFHCVQAVGPGKDDCRAFFDPARNDPLKADMDEWRISIHEALAHAGGILIYTYGRPNERRFDIRRIALHAPESVAAEPRVVWADGVLASVEGADTSDSQASLDAANVFLERLDA